MVTFMESVASRLRHLVVPVLAVAVVAIGVGAHPPRRAVAEPRTVPLERGTRYTEISPMDLRTMLAVKQFTLVNVHVPSDWEIEGTDLSIPFDRIRDGLGRLPADRRARLVVYCRSGRMSTIAARALVELGYTDVWDLAGGTAAWERAGYPLRRRDR